MRHDRKAAMAAHRPAHSEIYCAGDPNGSHFKEMGAAKEEWVLLWQGRKNGS